MELVTTSVSERFWIKVDPRAGDECWPWMAHRDSDGYGRFQLAARVAERAHRVSWMLTHGPIPDGLYVCHRCDNPPCVRPSHLFLGTHLDNVRDSSLKGRRYAPRNTGAANPEAKLTEADVRTIRERYQPGVITQRELAAEFGVSQPTISELLSGKKWRL